MRIFALPFALVLLMASAAAGQAQEYSLYQRAVAKARQKQHAAASGEVHFDSKPEVKSASWLAVKPPEPRKFCRHDLITIIVRENSEYTTDAKTQTEKKYTLDTKLADWISLSDLNLQPDKQSAGDPTINATLNRKLDAKGKVDREDTLEARITAEIIDIKPNGNLVLQARELIQTDEEIKDFTLTGACRSYDVNPDNSVLSTQVFDLQITMKHKGIARDATNRGLLPRLLDFLNPF